jgi:hypothetical protein
MSLEKILVISSEDKDSGSPSNSDFTVSLRENYLTQNINRVLVKEITVPNVFSNVRGTDYGTSRNNFMRIEDSTGSQSNIILPEGQYLLNSTNPANDFTTQLENVINTAISPDSVSITVSDLTGRITFTFTGDTYRLYPSDDDNAGNGKLADVIGITTKTAVYSAVITADGLPDLAGYQNVYVHSKEIAESHGIDGDSGLISLVDPVSLSEAPYGSYAYKQENDDELASIVYEEIRNLQRLRIVLRDNLGNILPIGSHKMNVTLKIYLAQS